MNTKVALLILGFLLFLALGTLFFLRQQSSEIASVKNEVKQEDSQIEQVQVLVINISPEVTDVEIAEFVKKLREIKNIVKVASFSQTDVLLSYRDENRSNEVAMREMEKLDSNPFSAKIRIEVESQKGIELVKTQALEIDTNNVINSISEGNDAMYAF